MPQNIDIDPKISIYDNLDLHAELFGVERKKIKSINPSIPIIMITKNEEEWLMDEAIASQISDYFFKSAQRSRQVWE